MHRRTALLLGLSALAIGCNRWAPNRPLRLRFADADAAFEAAQVTVQRRGYKVEQLDPINYYIRVTAKLDQPGKATSHIEIQVYNDGQMSLRAHGRHVRDSNKRVHKKLAAELDELGYALAANGGQFKRLAHR
jgi:hypothetical protein